ncbi:MAG: DnaA/Hda family protein [Simkaniaceae bacterium]|nr:DnaA/Hda family protein [Simkaniaceae bacterium]
MKYWNSFLDTLEDSLGKESVRRWIRPFTIIRFDAANLHLNTDNPFSVSWYREHVTTTPISPNGRRIKLHFYVNGEPFTEKTEKKAKTPTVPKTPPEEYFSSDHLFSHMTFDAFIRSQGNILACELLSRSLTCYTPIFLYGPSGSGKTHLLMATAHKLRRNKKHVLYVRAETFSQHVIRAFRTGHIESFRRVYRSPDCLIIDDMEKLKGRKVTQEELFHTFNRLHTEGKQILLSADAVPEKLSGIEERIKSRFEWGVTLSVSAPEGKERREAFDHKARIATLSFSEMAIAYLLETFHTFSSLMCAVDALACRRYRRGKGDTLSEIASIRSLLHDLIEEQTRIRITPDTITRSVAESFHMPLEAVLSKRQNHKCVLPRKVAMYLCRKMLHMPYKKIGEFFSRDHSTVISGIRSIEQGQVEKDYLILSALSDARRKLHAPGIRS